MDENHKNQQPYKAVRKHLSLVIATARKPHGIQTGGRHIGDRKQQTSSGGTLNDGRSNKRRKSAEFYSSSWWPWITINRRYPICEKRRRTTYIPITEHWSLLKYSGKWKFSYNTFKYGTIASKNQGDKIFRQRRSLHSRLRRKNFSRYLNTTLCNVKLKSICHFY